MRFLATLITVFTFLSITAQNNDNSLQNSLNKALVKDKVQLNSLEANVDPSKSGVQLKWSNLESANSKEYIIEKSSDKLDWKKVATVYSAGHKNHSMNYFHLDYMPLENLSYYRLIQKNRDGSEIISNIVPVNYVALDGNMAGTNLFPILAEDKIVVNIAFEEIFEKEILIVIRDKDGKEFYSKVIINIEDEALVAVPIENEVPKGQYLITATSENQIYSQNILVK